MSTQQRTLGSVSDLMAGLMMVFLFIAIAYMIEIKASESSLAAEAANAKAAKEQAEKALSDAEKAKIEAEKSKKIAEAEREASQTAKKKMTDIADAYFKSRDSLNRALHKEFDADLPKWKAEIENGTIRFLEPEILFDINKADIKSGFKDILSDFFPRYIRVLTSKEFKSEIEEVRIEGHTSTEWETAASDVQRYLNNADLSQRRAFAVLDYCYRLKQSRGEDEWLIRKLRANGLSSAEPILNNEGKMDFKRSRRVEFKVLTRTTERISEILKTAEDQADSEK